MSPKALITGATGFIGSHLVEFLIGQGWKVRCLVRPKSNTQSLQNFPVDLIRAEWNELSLLEQAVLGRDYVFHLAARIRSAPRHVYEEANHLLTRNLLSACLKKNREIKRFLFISSISAAGPSPAGSHSDESQAPAPTSAYGRTKLKAENAVQEVWHRIPGTIIRPPNVYGPRQQETGLLIKLVQRRIVPLLREKKETTSLIYVKDFVEGMVQAAISPHTRGQIYYLTDGKGYSWRDVILAIKRALLGNSLFFPVPEAAILSLALAADLLKSLGLLKTYFGRRSWQAMAQTSWLFSSEKAKRDFGFEAQYSLEEGIRETVDYYRRLAPSSKSNPES